LKLRKNMETKKYQSKTFLLEKCLMLVGVIGIFYSHYLTGLVLQGGSAIALACSGNSFFDCGKTLGSSYGKAFGIPVSFFATLYFGWMIYHLISNRLWLGGNEGRLSRKDYRRLFGLPYRVSLLAAGVCLVLAGISFFVLHAFCLYCLTLDGLVALTLGLSYYGIRISHKNAQEPQKGKSRSFLVNLVPLRGLDFVSQTYQRARRDLMAYGLHWYGRNWRRHSALVMLILFSAEMILPTHVLWAMRSESSLRPVRVTEANASEFGRNQLRIVKFTDFECPACQNGAVELERLREKYPNQVEVEVVNFPLSNKCNPAISGDLHPLSCLAAKIGIVMKEKGKFEEYYKRMMVRNENLNEKKIDEVIKQLNEDVIAVRKQAESSEVAQILAGDIEKGLNQGIQATPTLIVNGIKLSAGVDVATLESMILGTEAIQTVVDNVTKSIRAASLLPSSESVMTLASVQTTESIASDATIASTGCSGSGLSWYCNAGSTIAQVQSAMNSAADGATITFEAGSYAWTSGRLTLNNNKGVTLACATTRACIVTKGSGPLIYMDTVSGQNTRPYRLTGFFITGGSGSAMWLYGGNGGTPGTMHHCRIDNNTFDNFAIGSIAILLGGGSTPIKFKCVIDHNVFSGPTNFMSLKYLGPGTPNAYPSSVRGTADNVFLEDNIYNFTTASDLGSGCIDVWYAGSVVARHNDSKNCLWTAHGVTHSSVVNFEFYQNTLRRTAGSGGVWENGVRLFHHQGSGEIFVWSNTWHAVGLKLAAPLSLTHYRSATSSVAGYSETLGRCDGDNPLDGNILPNGYPCWMQPGRAPAGGAPAYGTLSPFYNWMNINGANGERVSVSLENPWGATNPSVADHIQENRDYYQSVSNLAQTSPTSPFDGTTGMGFGTIANRPATCTTNPNEAGGGVGYWATDVGEWDSSHPGPDGQLYRCSATDTWTMHYTPYTYPHPLVSEIVPDDSDGDGLLDVWEITYFGSISDPRAQAGVDADGDGFTNISEQTAGTSPIDSKSRLVITSLSLSETLGFTITWQSISNKTYTVQSSSNVASWTNVASVSAISSSTNWTDSSVTGSKKFYRIKTGP
jgi:protein-disulfide isomerase/uncharacterized membrane protein